MFYLPFFTFFFPSPGFHGYGSTVEAQGEILDNIEIQVCLCSPNR